MMKKPLTVAAVQFEMAENDKAKNLETMEGFIVQAAKQGVDVICFPEMCTTGYHFVTELGREAIIALAESTTTGPTVTALTALAREHMLHIVVGILERDESNACYNTAVVISPKGPIFQHRKIHAFENSAILEGRKLETFQMLGWTCGILICYDNNLPENLRVLALQGVELVFAPHQTGGFDINRAGMGRIPLDVWRNRHSEPLPMKYAVTGLKGREWLLKWLPCRAYDNNCYMVFANGVGIDGPEVRVGCNMTIDPEGLVVAKTTEPENAMIVAQLTKDKRINSLPSAHLGSRRPSLYGKIVEPITEVDTRLQRNLVSNESIK